MGRTHLYWGCFLLALACAGCALPRRGEPRVASTAASPVADAPAPLVETAAPTLQLAIAVQPAPAPAPAPAAAPAPAPAPLPVVYAIGLAASPRTIEVEVGQELVFVNRDGICHGFFSSSTPNAFDIGLLQPEARATVRFTHPGTVQVYCSLHEQRQLTIQVVPGASAQ